MINTGLQFKLQFKTDKLVRLWAERDAYWKAEFWGRKFDL